MSGHGQLRSFFYQNSATVVVQTTQKKRRNTHNCAIVILFALEERVPFAIEHDTYDLWSIFTLRSTSSLSFQSAVKLTHTPSVLALLVREEEWRERSPFSRYLSSIILLGHLEQNVCTNTALSYSPQCMCVSQFNPMGKKISKVLTPTILYQIR